MILLISPSIKDLSVVFRPEADNVVGKEDRTIYIMMAASMKNSQLRKTLKVKH